ncbi:hypothetical protein BCR36DRAFT_369575 [Piromyces finnis]|uniref:Uncharacterized protein n=1 Tax=Piromyces finnis TaxID=1754191 RepID=A0A1Y1VC18_9FUNG|nr:hypothetical protein BCR36DRAFT_369575 [Piromyces finnis]|eukprot:ORX52200.1 hypothetical protein BCR36DRAFT_369575 [Piromyces finnis]
MDSFSKEKENYFNNNNDNGIEFMKTQYKSDVDNMKDINFLNPLLESNSIENDSPKFNSNFNSSMLSINKSGKCLVDINKLRILSKQLEGCRIHQKKLVLTMNHIVNEYNILNKNFKKIQKELDNILNAPNEEDNYSDKFKSLISINGLPKNEEALEKNKMICPALKSMK